MRSFVLFSVCLVVFAGCAGEKTSKNSASAKADERIKFYADKISKSENHYPSYALLANAYLDKTRESGDPAYLAEARKSVQRSMEIQPNYQAMKTAAMIENYAHRFAAAAGWGEKAARASPEGGALDAEVSAVLVEAYLGLGQIEKAERVLNDLAKTGKRPDDFFADVARGLFFKELEKTDEAVKAFEAAAVSAEKRNAREPAVWALVMAAGSLIDSGRAPEAKSYLARAASAAPENKLLQIHQAEILLAEDRPREALEKYERLLQDSDDAEIHRQAFLAAQKLDDKDSAEKHFRSAVLGFRKIIDAGEIFALGPLAQIFCDGNRDLAEAERLARRNLEYKMDSEARKTYDCVKEKLR